jgi:hypothetical protein
MRKTIAVIALSLLCHNLRAQEVQEKKFSSVAVKEDLSFLQQQLLNVHAYPFTELSRKKYEQLFAAVSRSLTDSLTAMEFLQRVKPLMAPLSDEHADISLPQAVVSHRPIFLPFTLRRLQAGYAIDTVLVNQSSLLKGQVITQVNHVPVEQLVQQCAAYATGFPAQRREKALRQFGYLYTFSTRSSDTMFVTLQNNRQIAVAGTTAAVWMDYLKGSSGKTAACPERISYRLMGETGYIEACSFDTHGDSDFHVYEQQIDRIFQQVNRDQPRRIVIDVSRNSGGNSAVGDLLIQHFYARPYKTYQMNWKRSDAYLQTIKSWGLSDSTYEQLRPGEVLHYDASTVDPADNMQRFTGKVYVLVGKGTFSSAIMFATIIKDNAIAPLIGELPEDGHPSHFGEMYSVKLPNTQLAVRFGVKEWIRPAGKSAGNILVPDIPLVPHYPFSAEQLAHLPE